MPKSRLYVLYAAVGLFVAFYLYKKYRTVPDVPFAKIETLDKNGEPTSLSDQLADLQKAGRIETNDKPILVNYFASWCGPCMAELPALSAYYNKHKEEVVFVGLSDDSQQKIDAMIKNHGITYPVFKIESLQDVGVNSIPATVVYNHAGLRGDFHIGMLHENSISQLVQEATN